jgi:hypothetical protein
MISRVRYSTRTSMHTLSLIISSLLVLGACHNSATHGDGADAGPDPGDPGTPGSGTSSNGELQIVSLTATASTITGGNPLPTEPSSTTFIAIVTDTKGLGTIAGGQLEDATGTPYAAFESGAAMGTYTAGLSFEQIDQATTLDFPTSGGSMTLTAKFFDNDANMVSATVALALACRDGYGLEGACSGKCTDTSIDGANCGTCGNVCGAGLECTSMGTCVPVPIEPLAGTTSCANVRAVAPGTTCTEICAAGSGGRYCSTDDDLTLYEASSTCTGTSYSGGECGQPVVAAPNESFTCECH